MNPFIQDVIAEAVTRQSWYQKNANTIVAGLVMLSAVLSFVLTLGLDLPAMVAAGIPAAVTVIGAIVTKLTRNGVQTSMVDKLAATSTARATLPTWSTFDAEVNRISGQFGLGKHRLE